MAWICRSQVKNLERRTEEDVAYTAIAKVLDERSAALPADAPPRSGLSLSGGARG